MRATSVAALNKAMPKRESYRGRVFQYLTDQQDRGATDQEMQKAFGMAGDTLRPTRLSLLKDKMIADSGQTRQNENGNDCIVWVVSSVDQMGMF
jgi:hypothetical protein